MVEMLGLIKSLKGPCKMDYWDEIYRNGNYEWGTEPTITCKILREYLRKKDRARVLDIACGYGRDCIFLAKKGFEVRGIDISGKGLSIAERWKRDEGLDIEFKCIDFLTSSFSTDSFDGILVSNLIHHLGEKELTIFINKVRRILTPGGIAVLLFLSTSDNQYGKGEETGKNTFKTKGLDVHYFTEDETLGLFSLFKVLKLEEIEIVEPHSTGETHYHKEWLLVIKNEEGNVVLSK
ncbi:MAG: hypothetical protein COW04_12695 [Deltaproteobacteria bacterium CG12_big_fil_rev_8_21_14_0_65_43_10]|nr:MAG: hypothetical protein COW04_12695 [Deltaproteobacteria bacterium CG12_big_fil_rev_8_21_14_0_65_43_10]PIU86378.1 MAG: hypothetical protein COS67_02735 [Deltaproteobacteria bacterium CG06_land_8_20_14_3_00_44_19]PIX23785.1 MAG: hypothetical protein COZ68_08280 [Deltaproteobacteria bacterium CG_4_8_14_3_um_filter_43_13]PIZ20458.1 MAG: hypothetical protein COY50_04570 [Deltaproteobacteria bacterium CG_4_10_14_0_8_um_filter_43_12]PJB38680.1 MAG: hypothetical protein CO106_12310 [Deltaproteoba